MRRDVREDESGGRIGAGQEDDSSEGAHGAKRESVDFWTSSEKTPSVGVCAEGERQAARTGSHSHGCP